MAEMQDINNDPESINTQQKRNQAAIVLLDAWFADESGYEEDNAEAIERALASVKDNPISLREPSSK